MQSPSSIVSPELRPGRNLLPGQRMSWERVIWTGKLFGMSAWHIVSGSATSGFFDANNPKVDKSKVPTYDLLERKEIIA